MHYCKWEHCLQSTHSTLPEQLSGQSVDMHMNQILCIRVCDWVTTVYCGLSPPLQASSSEPSEKLWDQSWGQVDIFHKIKYNKMLYFNHKPLHYVELTVKIYIICHYVKVIVACCDWCVLWSLVDIQYMHTLIACSLYKIWHHMISYSTSVKLTHCISLVVVCRCCWCLASPDYSEAGIFPQ